MDFNNDQLENHLNNRVSTKTFNDERIFKPLVKYLLSGASLTAIYKGYYLALCLIFLLFLWSLLTRFFRHFQRIVARDFLNRHECDINIYRY